MLLVHGRLVLSAPELRVLWLWVEERVRRYFSVVLVILLPLWAALKQLPLDLAEEHTHACEIAPRLVTLFLHFLFDLVFNL